MSTVVEEAKTTPEDLLAMPDGVRYELVDGNLVERHMGFQSSRIGGRIFALLEHFCQANGLGWVLPADASYQCFPEDPRKVRKPDVSFVRAERLPADQEPEGHATLPPDLAVEVVSPGDLFEEVAEKVQEYVRAGVRLVWVVDPATRIVQVHRADGSGTILRAQDELTGEDVVPGFRCRVSEIFIPPAGTTPRS